MMKKEGLLIELLKKMSESPSGGILLRQHMNMSEGEQEEYHHAEILSDMRLARWKSDSLIRITADGYEYLERKEEDEQT